MKNLSRSVPFALATALAAPASAQTSAPATPLPDLGGFSLPSSRPTPRVAPDAEPTTGATAPRPTPSPAAPVVTAPVEPPRVVPTVRPTPVARPTPAPRVVVPARPEPVATPTAAAPPTGPLPEPVTAPTPATVAPTPVTAAPTPAVSATPQTSSQAAPVTETRSSWGWVALAILAAALAGVALLVWRRGQRGDAGEAPEDAAPPELPVAAPRGAVAPAPTAPTPPPVPAATAARARIEIECVATRGGTNLLSVAVDYKIVVRNVGDALATGIRVDIRLLGMGTQHDALLAALFAMPIDKSIAAPFDLPPGTAVDLGGMAMHPKETIETVEIGGRAMVVPLLAVNLRYGLAGDGSNGGKGQTARPFVIGIDPGTGGRLQPFRLDAGARMVQNVAIIAYTDGVTT
ncbi:hypothetical protein [Sphingomonas sp. PAMC 26617]|uniref:hypothetical protein n=1 Tax=Sphingomonas sp. PAMC 26617 TaxID=1112216 RepID=UPI001E2D0F8E|nr:hypothetical protein [Sphingomonas sp. PAMC 26617]